VEDYVDLIELILLDFGRFAQDGFSVYNVGGGQSNRLSLNDLFSLLEREHGLTVERRYGEFLSDEPRHFLSDIGSIAAKGWKPRRTDPAAIVREMLT
jgi:hypothetical protein